MSNTYLFLPQDVNVSNEMEAWRNMINCVINFLSASTNLASNLESNHAIENSIQGNYTPLLITAHSQDGESTPTESLKLTEVLSSDLPWSPEEMSNKNEIVLNHVSSDIKTTDNYNVENVQGVLNNTLQNEVNRIPDRYQVTSPEQVTAVLSYAQEELLAEPNDQSQLINYINTQDMGDCTETHSPVEEINLIEDEINLYYNQLATNQGCFAQNNSCSEYLAAPLPLPYGVVEEESVFINAEDKNDNIKESESAESCFFQEYTDSEQTIDSSNLQSTFEQSSDPEKCLSDIESQDKPICNKFYCPTCSQEIDEKKLNEINILQEETSSALSKLDKMVDSFVQVEPIKSEEIQTNPTNRFKSTVKALITKSAELQKPIEESQCSNWKNKPSREKSPAKNIKLHRLVNKAQVIPKNLNELKEHLDSISSSVSSDKSLEQIPHQKKTDGKLVKKYSKGPLYKKNKSEEQKDQTYVQLQQMHNATCENKTKDQHTKEIPKRFTHSKKYASVESVVKQLINNIPKICSKRLDQKKEKTQESININKKIITQKASSSKNEEHTIGKLSEEVKENLQSESCAYKKTGQKSNQRCLKMQNSTLKNTSENNSARKKLHSNDASEEESVSLPLRSKAPRSRSLQRNLPLKNTKNMKASVEITRKKSEEIKQLTENKTPKTTRCQSAILKCRNRN